MVTDIKQGDLVIYKDRVWIVHRINYTNFHKDALDGCVIVPVASAKVNLLSSELIASAGFFVPPENLEPAGEYGEILYGEDSKISKR